MRSLIAVFLLADWTVRAAVPGESNYGQNGRFPMFDGVKVSPGYPVPQAEAVFAQLISAP